MWDAIFVFAGAKTRKLRAISMFKEGKSGMLILSAGRFELRRFPELPIEPRRDLMGMAQPIPAPERHCFVIYPAGDVVWIKRLRLGTLTEVVGLRDWLRAHPDVRVLAIISSGYHLPRIRLCCERLLPREVEVRYEASPEPKPSLRILLKETMKRAVYRIVLGVRANST